MTSINERLDELSKQPEEAKARVIAQVAAIRKRQQAVSIPSELLEALEDLVHAVTRTDMLAAKEQWYWPEVQRAKAAIKAAKRKEKP